MKRTLSALLLALLAVGLATTAARADEDDKTQLEFVRRLRERHLNQLAQDYLEILGKTGSPALKQLIPVELARTKVSAARMLEPERRKKLFEEARQLLEDYAKKNEATPAAAQARLEKARIATYEGQALFTQAVRLKGEDRAASNNFARQAEERFKQAGAELETALKNLPAQDQATVRFEKAKNLLDQAYAILDTGKDVENKRRATLVSAARDSLEAIEKEAAQEEKSEALHLARAWLYKAYDGVDGSKVKEYFKRVMNSAAPEAVPAQRLVLYFQMQTESGPAQRKTAQEWLKLYRNQRNSPEGYGVRFILAKADLLETQELSRSLDKIKDAKKRKEVEKQVNKLYDQAQREFTELASKDNDNQEEAARFLTFLSIRRMGETTPIDQLKTADDCMLKARFELFKMQETADLVSKATDPEKRKALEKKRAEHESNVIKGFVRGIDLAKKEKGFKDSVRKIGEAKYYLTYVLLMLGDSAGAAKLGDEVARDPVQSKFSAATAGFALDAYSRLMAGDKAADAKQVEAAIAARKKLYDLTTFILKERWKTWQGDAVLQISLYQKALVCLREKADVREDDPVAKLKREVELTWEAIDLLGKLAPEFRGYHFAQCQQAFTALQGVRHMERTQTSLDRAVEDAKADLAKKKDKGEQAKAFQEYKKATELKKALEGEVSKQRAAFQGAFQKTMKGLKAVTADTDLATTQLYFSVQVEQGNLLFTNAIKMLDSEKKEDVAEAAKRYADLGDFTTRMRQEFGAAGKRLSDEMRTNFDQAIVALENRYRLGVGQLDYRAGRFDKVLAPNVTGAVIAQVKALGKEPEIVVKDDRVIGNLLGLAMRANVQVGKIPEALEVLALLQRVRAEKGAFDPVQTELETFIRELKLQMKTLGQKKDAKALDVTTKNFSLFLEKMTTGQDVAKLSQKDRLFMANCYSNLNRHAEAITYLKTIPEPKIDGKKKLDKMDKKELQELSQYWVTRVLYGHELRLNKQLTEAKKVLEEIATHPQSMGKFLAHKELNHVEEDAGRYGNATVGWGKLLQNKAMLDAMANTGADSTRIKALYFECYYHYVYSTFNYGKRLEKKEKQKPFIDRAVDYIRRLEVSPSRDGWELAGPHLMELICTEPLLWEQVPDITRKYGLVRKF
jgi:hypothetical protein